ncbi:MAG TPA: cupin domain-containing protein [Chitinophagaceae bacterium]
MKTAFPLTIEAKTGERITFLGVTVKNGIEYLEAINEVQPNTGPPMHVHYKQDEYFTVVSGKMGYQEQGGEKKYAGPGETSLFKAGVPHKFWNAGKEVLVCTGYLTPPDNFIYFISRVFESSNKNGGRPGIYDAAFLLNRYRSDFDILEIPAFVRKVIFPIVLFLGNLTGKNKKFADAPGAL